MRPIVSALLLAAVAITCSKAASAQAPADIGPRREHPTKSLMLETSQGGLADVRFEGQSGAASAHDPERTFRSGEKRGVYLAMRTLRLYPRLPPPVASGLFGLENGTVRGTLA